MALDNEWTAAFDRAESEGGQGGNFLRLPNSGDRAVIAFVGKPQPREVIWIDGKSEDYNPDNPDHHGLRPKARWLLNVFVAKDREVKVWECSNQTFRDLGVVLQKHGTACLYEVLRRGSGKDTQYIVTYEKALTPQQAKHLEGLELHDLTKLVGRRPEPPPHADLPPDDVYADAAEDDSIPF